MPHIVRSPVFRLFAFSFGFVLLMSSCEAGDADSDDANTSDASSARHDASSEDSDDASTAVDTPESNPRDAGAPSKPPEPSPGSRTKDSGPAPDDSDDAGAPPDPSNKPSPGPSTTTAGEIDAFVMDVAFTFGVGGTPTIQARPTILFKDGSACRDANFVVRGLDVETHKRMFPNAWLQWKVIDGRITLQNGANWRVLDFQLKYPPNPSTFTLDKMFTNITGLGGGASDTLVVAQRDIRLTSDRRVEVGSLAGVVSPSGTAVSIPPDRRGTYQVDGYVIEFKWDDGRTTKTSFVYSAQDPKAIYVGGVGYVLAAQ